MDKIDITSAQGSYEIFCSLSQKSFKHKKYFDIYDSELEKYRDKNVTVVEIGVLDGGSLFLWREFFGKNARIIGIDFNPEAARWVDEGFEIYIGDQADKKFWNTFYEKVGLVDVVIDDGGHTDLQQLITLEQAIPRIRDNGLILVEDTHASLMEEFGNPSRYSFLEISKNLVNRLYSKSPFTRIQNNQFSDYVYAIKFYESVITFSIDRTKCGINSEIENKGNQIGNSDFREANQTRFNRKLLALRELLSGNPVFVKKIFRRKSANSTLKLSKYFRKFFGWIVVAIDRILFSIKRKRNKSQIKEQLRSSILKITNGK